MLKLYEDLYKKYTLVVILGGLFVLFLTLFLTFSIILALFLCTIFIFVVAFFFNIQADKRIKVVSKHYYDCDAETYTKTYETFYKRLKIGITDNKELEPFVRIGLSTGYISLGKNKEALDILSDFNPIFKNTKISMMNKVTYLNNLIVVYRNLKQYEEAKVRLNELSEMINYPKVDNELKYLIESAYMSNKISLDIYENPTKENLKYAENYYKDILKLSKSKSDIVNYNYKLAYINEKLKNKKAELKYLNFVIENGRSLYIVKEAKNRIQEINN
ncbi:MAG: hypothetical protein IJ105_02985 [Bacilli bacterium]|nr:hypothetical protein [Bacilli bacterium]